MLQLRHREMGRDGQPQCFSSAGPEENIPHATESSSADMTLAASGHTGSVCQAFQAARPGAHQQSTASPERFSVGGEQQNPCSKAGPRPWFLGDGPRDLGPTKDHNHKLQTRSLTDLLLVCQVYCFQGLQSCCWDRLQHSESSHRAQQWCGADKAQELSPHNASSTDGLPLLSDWNR